VSELWLRWTRHGVDWRQCNRSIVYAEVSPRIGIIPKHAHLWLEVVLWEDDVLRDERTVDALIAHGLQQADVVVNVRLHHLAAAGVRIVVAVVRVVRHGRELAIELGLVLPRHRVSDRVAPVVEARRWG
jgi:hypothetical protein